MLKKFKKFKFIKKFSKILKKCPQKKGICIKVYTTSPKKPNSAVRKIAKIRIISHKVTTIVGIPGQGHRLQDFNSVLIKGGRLNDVPGVRFKAIRGKYDFKWAETFNRRNRRSKYGIPLIKNVKRI